MWRLCGMLQSKAGKVILWTWDLNVASVRTDLDSRIKLIWRPDSINCKYYFQFHIAGKMFKPLGLFHLRRMGSWKINWGWLQNLPEVENGWMERWDLAKFSRPLPMTSYGIALIWKSLGIDNFLQDALYAFTSTRQISEKDTKSWVMQITVSDCLVIRTQIKWKVVTSSNYLLFQYLCK